MKGAPKARRDRWEGQPPSVLEIQREIVAAVRKSLPHVLIFAIPNGGARNPVLAQRLNAEGVVAGIPDLFIPEFHLFIEVKTPVGHMSKAQREYAKYLETDGKERAVADYIAGMTDNYAVSEYVRIFVPKSWMDLTT